MADNPNEDVRFLLRTRVYEGNPESREEEWAKGEVFARGNPLSSTPFEFDSR